MRYFSRLLAVVGLLAIVGIGAWRFLPASTSRPTHASTGATTTPIQHVVVIMMENHSFDNLFGTFPGANGATLPQASNPIITDINHDDPSTRAAIDGGKMDAFSTNGMYQYKQSDIPIYWNYALHFGLGDTKEHQSDPSATATTGRPELGGKNCQRYYEQLLLVKHSNLFDLGRVWRFL